MICAVERDSGIQLDPGEAQTGPGDQGPTEFLGGGHRRGEGRGECRDFHHYVTALGRPLRLPARFIVVVDFDDQAAE
ncbi:MAG: hypothetical protein LC792_28325, partial [Actinobacteria bacterium]|nr:hypothetical protein [Actinomycetota bacterium]